MSEEIKRKYTDEIVCPYCGDEIQDSWDYHSDNGKLDCDGCGREFSYSRDYEVTYTTMKINCEEKKHNYVFDKEYDQKQDYRWDSVLSRYGWFPLPTEEHKHVKVYKCIECDAIDYKSTSIAKKEET